jgi:hypothetical protein
MVKKGAANQAPAMTPDAVLNELDDLPWTREVFFVISLDKAMSGNEPWFLIFPFPEVA